MKFQLFAVVTIATVLIICLCINVNAVRLGSKLLSKQEPEDAEEGYSTAEGIGQQIAEAEENPEAAAASLPSPAAGETASVETPEVSESPENIEIPVPVQAPPTVVTSPIPSTAPGSIIIKNENGCGGCCTQFCSTETGEKKPTDLSELNSAIGKLYTRAAAAKLPVGVAPKINSLQEASDALSTIEPIIDSATSEKQIPVEPEVPTEEVASEAPIEAASEVPSEKIASEVPAEKESLEEQPVLFQTKRFDSKVFPRFVLQDENADETIKEANEAEKQAEQDSEEQPEVESETEESSLSDEKAKALYTAEILTLETMINDIASENTGIKDILGTQERIRKIKGEHRELM